MYNSTTDGLCSISMLGFGHMKYFITNELYIFSRIYNKPLHTYIHRYYMEQCPEIQKGIIPPKGIRTPKFSNTKYTEYQRTHLFLR